MRERRNDDGAPRINAGADEAGLSLIRGHGRRLECRGAEARIHVGLPAIPTSKISLAGSDNVISGGGSGIGDSQAMGGGSRKARNARIGSTLALTALEEGDIFSLHALGRN